MLTWDEVAEPNTDVLTNYQIIRRNGAVVPFEPSRIAVAMMKAFMAVHRTCAFNSGSSFLRSHSYSSLLFAVTGSIKQRLFALTKLVGTTIKLQPMKANGFFSASKANLRNAP